MTGSWRGITQQLHSHSSRGTQDSASSCATAVVQIVQLRHQLFLWGPPLCTMGSAKKGCSLSCSTPSYASRELESSKIYFDQGNKISRADPV